MSQVQLYVYDLSGGLAKALSMQMTGKQIDGIWHTSVVVFGKEIFYGQHGRPLQIVDFGETAIDEDTFNDYLNEIREHYTADKANFNCNSFTNDVIGFLTGEHIPSWIRDLPADFLSTPFGASMRPMIDNMFRRPTPGTTPPPATPQTGVPSGDISNLLLQAVAQRAASSTFNQPETTNPGSSTVAAAVHIATNPPSLDSLIRSHKASVIFFTSSSCGPCRAIEPAFEDIAREKAGPDVVFVKVSLDVPAASEVADGERIDELKGADRGELKTRVDLLLYQAFPPHPHVSLKLPVLRALSTQAIVYEQVPDLAKLLSKIQTTTGSLGLAGYPHIAAMATAARVQTTNSINDQVAAQFSQASDEFIERLKLKIYFHYSTSGESHCSTRVSRLVVRSALME
ncbi:PPPDE peptidase domain-containing protein 2 AltName: Full=Protein FAM152B [Rhizoctonia solani AG-1 IB]|uniref:Rhizoctonia solani AG1-IB WGS project CAOJ00000000 data, isolate 7/3/14, contig 11066 n=1 Tax=Thanatephorus cucumeris (strain AG1-IB / isolate 7/3/14) TaxID=1108050 RepID=M5BWU8_THACB|nr:PPPDE peptidase domain-containing protein 2 AltName: Full=Protein FAM152B [Rhizoctonia solani AG-1 IB]